MVGLCKIEGCEKGGKLRHGMCNAHYTRWWRHGDANVTTRAASGEPMAWMLAHLSHNSEDCLTWPFGEYVRGYGQMFFRGRPQYAHRVMCILAHGEPPEESPFALHSCGRGNQGCVNPRHLYWGTLSDNAHDAFSHGALKRGEEHPSATLTEDQVIEIRALRGVLPQSAIAARYGIKQQHVSQIQRRLRWAHVPDADVERTRAIHKRMQIAFGEAPMMEAAE